MDRDSNPSFLLTREEIFRPPYSDLDLLSAGKSPSILPIRPRHFPQMLCQRRCDRCSTSTCANCHGPAKAKGGVNFASFTNTVSVYHDLKLWEKAAVKLREQEMPPDGKPQPTIEQRAGLVHWIEKTLKDLDDGRIAKDPGRVLIHRLSRTEYNFTIRDLLGVDSRY